MSLKPHALKYLVERRDPMLGESRYSDHQDCYLLSEMPIVFHMLIRGNEKTKAETTRWLDQLGIHKSVFKVTETLFMQAMMKAGFKYHGHSAELRLFNLDLQNNERLKICSAYILQWEASNKSQELGFTRVHIDEYFEGQSALEEFNSALLSLKKIHDRIGRENFVIQTPKNKKTLAAIQAIVEKNRSLNLGDVMTSEYFKSYLGLSHGIYHEFFEAIGGKARNKFNRFIAAKIGREHDRRHESEQTSKPGFEGIESRFTASTIKSRLAGGHETYKRLSKSVGESGLLGKKNEFISFLAEKRNTNLIHSANSDGLPLGRRSA